MFSFIGSNFPLFFIISIKVTRFWNRPPFKFLNHGNSFLMNWYAIFLCKGVFLASHFNLANIYPTSSRDHHLLINMASPLILAWAWNVSCWCATIQSTSELQESTHLCVVIAMSNLLLGAGQLLISSFHIIDSCLFIHQFMPMDGPIPCGEVGCLFRWCAPSLTCVSAASLLCITRLLIALLVLSSVFYLRSYSAWKPCCQKTAV